MLSFISEIKPICENCSIHNCINIKSLCSNHLLSVAKKEKNKACIGNVVFFHFSCIDESYHIHPRR